VNVKRQAAGRLSRAEGKARTRARLLDAGERVFAAQGFHAATVEDIADAAGFTRGAFYANFADKADLLLTLLDERSRIDMEELVDRLAAPSVDHGLGALLEWFEETFAAPSPLDRAVAEFVPVAAREPAHADRMRRRLRRVREQVTTIVEDECAQAGFVLSIPAARFATMIIAVVDGLAALHRLDPVAAPAELLPETLACLGEGLATRGEVADGGAR